MGIKKCPNGHFYDNEKYDFCPYCNNKNILNENGQKKDKKSKFSLFEKTVAKFKSDAKEDVTVSYNANELSDQQLTIAKNIVEGIGSPVSGWIVCIEGGEKGKSFEIRQGVNYVGRNSDMDIAFINEPTITRDKHFSLVFEPNKAETFLKAENGAVYLNDKYMDSVNKLKENDIITAGELKFIFIPYCNGERKW